MARLNKQGLDYFPLDVHLNDKIELIEAEHGLVGFSVFIKLLQKVYFNGYFCSFSNDEIILFSKRVNVDINTINVIIKSLFARELLSEKLYKKYSILTSSGIQERFLEATLRRKMVTITKEYWLLDKKLKNDNINWVNVGNNSQSKVDYIKGNKTKSKETKEGAIWLGIVEYFKKTVNAKITKPRKQTVIDKAGVKFINAYKEWGKDVNLEEILITCDYCLTDYSNGWSNGKWKLEIIFPTQENFYTLHMGRALDWHDRGRRTSNDIPPEDEPVDLSKVKGMIHGSKL